MNKKLRVLMEKQATCKNSWITKQRDENIKKKSK